MTVYMSRLFPKSNSSTLLQTNKAITSQITRLRENIFLLDSGITPSKLTTPDQLQIPTNQSQSQSQTKPFYNKVGFIQPKAASEQPIKTQMLERMFMDMVAGEPDVKERAVGRFNDMVGSTEEVVGEPGVVLPRRFVKDQAWIELKRKWRFSNKVRGFPVEKVRGGYAVAVAGYVGFLPFRSALARQKLSNDRFSIESVDDKRKKLTVF